MKLVPKPEGFELRDKRSEKKSDAALWVPQDAMFDASKEQAAQDVEALFICWREKMPDGNTRTHFRFAGDRGKGESLMLTAIGRFMGWQTGG